MCRVSGFLEIEFKQEKNQIHQTIRMIPSQRKYRHFFLRDKYKLGQKVDNFISTLYIGDGENIVFLESQKFINIFLVKYIVKNKMDIDLSPKKIFIEGDIPLKESCSFCRYSGKLEGSNKIRCQYYQEIIKPKVYCRDFFER